MTARPSPAVCNFRAPADSGELIANRCDAAQLWLDSLSDDARIAALADTRPLHAALFAGLAPDRWPDAAGVWRGTPGTSLVAAPRAVFLARRLPGLRFRDLCLPAAEVPGAMAALGVDLRQLWIERPGRDDPWRDAAFAVLAEVTARFFRIHPYMDGNGHVWRLTLPLLGARLGLRTRNSWTIHRRPYGPEFSLALQWYGDHPAILADQLRRWLAPE